jgi:hypothetical protein
MSYSEYTRPLTEEERRFLQKPTMKKQKRDLLYSFFLWSAVWGSIFACLLFIHLRVWSSPFLIVLIAIIGVFELVNLETLFRWRGYARETELWRSAQYSGILKDNTVAVTEVQADSAVVFEAEGDEGDLMVFDIGDRRLFWVHGQSLVPTFGSSQWPSNHFEIISSVNGEADLGIRSLGGPLLCIRKLSTRGIHECPAEHLLTGTLDDVERLFKMDSARK